MTNDDQILGLLERATSDTEVGPAPIESIVRNATRTRRRQRNAVVATFCVGAVVVVATASQLTQADSPDVTSRPDSIPSVHTKENPFSVIPEGGLVDTNAIHEAAVPLSECPELLHFLTSPEVNEFQTTYFGDPYTPETRFYPDCPDLEYMRARYEEARARMLEDK